MDETQSEWSDWIEHKPGNPCPIPWAKAREWDWSVGGSGSFAGYVIEPALSGACDFWSCVTSYRYLKSAAPKGWTPPGSKPVEKPAEELWYPPVPEGFGPWREHDGSGRSPVPLGSEIAWLLDGERETKRFIPSTRPSGGLPWSGVVAYCVKIDPDEREFAARWDSLMGNFIAACEPAATIYVPPKESKPLPQSDLPGIARYEKWQREQPKPAVPVPEPRTLDGFDTLAPMDRVGGSRWGL